MNKVITAARAFATLLAATLLAISLLLLTASPVRAEGSWQMGLFEGLSFRQPLYETNANANRSVLRVDILSPGEVINVLACGTHNNGSIRVLMYDPFGALVYDTTDTANVDCADDFSSDFDPAVVDTHQFVTNSTGVYEVHLTNLDGTFLNRFDVTVTDSVNDMINPRAAGGRLWSDYWYFWTGSFAQSRSTDADLYVVADSGFIGTHNVWKVDLNNFAGFGYGLKANGRGVQSPNAAGDIVAGLSVPRSGNSFDEEYPIYLNYPDRNFPLPVDGFTVSELVFLGDQQADSAITSGAIGTFSFSTDHHSASVYEIIIDTGSPAGGGPDGSYGQGDVFLRGTALPGTNTIPWDGKDNNGKNVALGAYTARLSVHTGEFHFVLEDAETSGGPGDTGLKIFRTNRNGFESPATLFWDDATVLNSSAADAFNRVGIFDGDHNVGAFNAGGVGNVALIDTYTFGFSVTPESAPVVILPGDRAGTDQGTDQGTGQSAESGISVSTRAEVSANEVTYWLTVVNTSSADLQSVSLEDNLDTVFGVGNYTIAVPPVLTENPDTISLNMAFSGSGAGAVLIDPTGSTLASGSRAVVRITVMVDNLSDRGAGFAVYSNQVVASAQTDSGITVSEASVDGDLADPDGNSDEQSPTVVNLNALFTVSGSVFEDNGESATAHDGVQGSAESPLAGVALELRDNAGNLIDTTTTDASGRYVISVPAAYAGEPLQLISLPAAGLLSISEAYTADGKSNVADGIVQFTADQGSSGVAIDFGKVKVPQWLSVSDSVSENNPDTFVFHTHRYRATSAGELQFSYSDLSSSPDNPGFNASLFIDKNCNAAIDSSDTSMPSVMSVVAGQEVCVINKVYIPANAANEDTYHTAITANMTYSDISATGHSVGDSRQLVDVTRVVALGQGVLVLDKTVQNVTDAGAVTTSNTAVSGDILRYSIDFRNSGTGPVTEVVIADSTPAFTVLEAAVQCPQVMPDGTSTCQVLAPSPGENSAGYGGPIQWQFTGTLSAGAESRVSFQIRVE